MKKFKILLLIPMGIWLALPSCDLGNFEPFDLFAKEELEDEPFTLQSDENCNITFFVNQDRISLNGANSEIKGSLYYENSENQTVYFTNGDFDLTSDADGNFSSFSGYGITNFPETGIFSTIQNEARLGAAMELNQGSVFDNSDSLPLADDQCYLHGIVDGGPAILTYLNGGGNFQFSEYYIAFDDPFIAYKGDIFLGEIQVIEGKVAVSNNGLIPYEPESPLDVFNNFRGHLYIDGVVPFTVQNIPFSNDGVSVVDAEPIGDNNAQAFFEGNGDIFYQGTNGILSYGNNLTDTILSNHNFFQNADLSARQGEQIILSNSTSAWDKEGEIEQFDFIGIYGDTLDLYTETLLDHPVLEFLSYQKSDTASVQGSYGNNFQTWVYSISNNATLTLAELTTAEFTEAKLSITYEEIEFSGLYQSPFEYIPSILLAGAITDNGDITLQGNRRQAYLIGGETYFVTFFMTMQIINGIPEVTILAEASTCSLGGCPRIPVDVQFDYETSFSRLCINDGAACTN